MATTETYYVLFLAVVLVIVVIGLLLLALQRLRRRKAELLKDLEGRPRANADRAFNRLAMARREADIVAHQGLDVSAARDQIAQSQAALDNRQFDRAYERAQSAHESLVAARQGRPLPSGPPARDPPAVPSRPVLTSSSPSATSVPVAPPAGSPGLPRNRVESQFEMRLLAADLETAQRTRPSDPGTLAAVDFQSRARAAFDAEQYTDAFRFALKGRRGLGGNVETVAVGPTSGSARGPVVPGNPDGVPLDPGAAADRAASSARCPNCGYPTSPDDAFCRGCGTPREPSTCPRCGAPRSPADTFCGRCGERFS